MTPSDVNEDAALTLRVAGGDREAFSALYDRYAPRVYGLALHMLQDPGLAEEVAQEAFLKLWTRASQFNPRRGSPLAWLLTITRRTALDRIRFENRRPVEAHLEDPDRSWHHLADPRSEGQEARWRSLRFELLDLPAEQRQAIELAYYHGLSHSQIAEHLEIPLGTAKTRIRLGMEKLREAWLEGQPGQAADPKDQQGTLTLTEKQRP